MTSCLHVMCGPYGLLFDIGRIVEVGDVPSNGVVAAGRCVWRNRQMPVLDMSFLLAGRRGERPQCLVVENAVDGNHREVMLVVDSIVSIRECDERHRIDMPWLNNRLSRLFVSGWLDVDAQACLFEVRLPLDAECFTEPESHDD